MLHIIGIILKIFGIILAAILGILVLLVCIVLFVPVRYEGEAFFPGNIDDIYARGKITWLLHLISAQIIYEKGEVKWRFRIAWKKRGSDITEEKLTEVTRVDSLEKTEEEKRKKLPEQSEKPVQTATKDMPDKNGEELKDETRNKPRKEPSHEPERKPVQEHREKMPEKTPTVLQKIMDRIKAFFEKIKYTFSQICGKIREITDKKEKVMELLEDEVHRNAFVRLKKEMVWIKRFLKPNRFRMNLHFGFEDPYRTGQCLAVLSMLYPFVGEYMNIQPEFEKQVLEGEAYVKGTVRAVYLVIFAGKMLLDKHVRATYRNIRNFEF